MAEPILFEAPPRDARAHLAARLSAAPAVHADAVLAAYEVLQGLHDRGVLELLRGALGAGDALVEMAVKAADTPESIRALRNLLLLAKTLGAIDPTRLGELIGAVPDALARTHADAGNPPGLLALLRTFVSKDFRRGLAAMSNVVAAFGRNLPHAGTG